MVENFAAFFIIIALGVLFQILRPGGANPDNARHIINTVVIKFMLPALCFRVISTMSIDINTILFPLSAIITVISMLALTFVVLTALQRFMRIEKKQKGALILTAAFGNVTFFGLPIIASLYGQEAQKYPLMYDFMAAGILLWTVGVQIAAYYGGEGKMDGSTFKTGLKTLASMPPIWAMVLAFAANFSGLGLKTPLFMNRVLEMMSAPVVPLMIFSVGLMLKVPRLKDIVIAMPSVIIKLIVSPICAFGIALILGMSGLPLKATIVEAALPVMIMTLALSSEYKLDHTLAALTTIISIVLSFITVPVAVFLANKI
jgi:predicted permease